MNNIFAILSFFCILPTPLKDFSQPVQSMFQVDEKPKKECKYEKKTHQTKPTKQVEEKVNYLITKINKCLRVVKNSNKKLYI